MRKKEIIKINDKDLQLRYFLGGLNYIKDGEKQLCNYWTCKINCSCLKVSDDENLLKVKNFIKKHNITNERFLILSYNYLINSIMKYNYEYSPLFLELENVLKPYNFTHTKFGKKPDNNFRQTELENIINESIVQKYCTKYKLDSSDFISLAKTSLNYNFYNLKIAKNPNDTFTYELAKIIESFKLYVPREIITKYREKYKQNTQLVIDTKKLQQRYLKLIKELFIKEPNLANQLIKKELNELGFSSRKNIKKLILKK